MVSSCKFLRQLWLIFSSRFSVLNFLCRLCKLFFHWSVEQLFSLSKLLVITFCSRCFIVLHFLLLPTDLIFFLLTPSTLAHLCRASVFLQNVKCNTTQIFSFRYFFLAIIIFFLKSLCLFGDIPSAPSSFKGLVLSVLKVVVYVQIR